MKSSQGNPLQIYTDWGMSPKVLLSIREWLSQFDHRQKGRIWSLNRAKYIPSTVNLGQSGQDFISHIRDHLQFCLNRGIVPQSLMISEGPLKVNFFKSSTKWGKSRHWGMTFLLLSKSPLQAWSRGISSYSRVSQAKSRLLAFFIPSQTLQDTSIIRHQSNIPSWERDINTNISNQNIGIYFPMAELFICITQSCIIS